MYTSRTIAGSGAATMDPSQLDTISSGARGHTQEQVQAEREKQIAAEERRAGMLATILDGQARERLGRIRVVKPDKAMQVENMILQMAQSGKVNGRISDQALADMLESISGQSANQKSKITIARRSRVWDSDSD